jgi:hypothetical protein
LQWLQISKHINLDKPKNICLGFVDILGTKNVYLKHNFKSQKERDHWEDQDVGGWTILKWILER